MLNPLLSTSTVSNLVDITLRGPRSFGINLVSSAFAMHLHQFICVCGMTTKSCCKGGAAACVGEFYQSCMRRQSNVLHPFACAVHAAGANIDPMALQLLAFLHVFWYCSDHVLPLSGQVVDETVPV